MQESHVKSKGSCLAMKKDMALDSKSHSIPPGKKQTFLKMVEMLMIAVKLRNPPQNEFMD